MEATALCWAPRADAPAALITPAPVFKGSAVQDAIRAHGQAGQHEVDKRAYVISYEISGSGNKFTSCLLSLSSALVSIESAAPYPSDTDLASWFSTLALEEPTTTLGIDQAEKACETLDATPTVPASLTSAYSSYEKEASAWQTEAVKGASSVAKSCPTNIGNWVELTFATDTAECKAIVAKMNGKSGAASSSAPVFAAVAAFAGLVGVLAL
ncbi:hypothetical protein N0V85_002802 [Neurospora sp. IMI 360204]|nr:hypothetical protein N0V85_002802 [Neurospora sp. IMI 360204]